MIQAGKLVEANNKVIISAVMLPGQANVAGNVHGGEIMKMMDSAAAACAQKYARANCVTARVDELQFHLPIFVGALVTVTAVIDYVGSTSMDIYVVVESEDLECANGPELALSAHFTMVAMSKSGRPQKVEAFTPETDDEECLYEQVKVKIAEQKANRGKAKGSEACILKK